MDRLTKIRHGLTREMRGLELGPSYNPCVPKADGWTVETIDHASQTALIAKFAEFGRQLPIERIEPVDWIWNDQALHHLIGPKNWGGYDYVVASHVIEHMPDLLGFLKSVEVLLRPGGTLSLVVPDKRFCFDFFKALTLAPEVLRAHRERPVRHSEKTVFEWYAYSSSLDGRGDWNAGASGELTLTYTLAHAQREVARYRTDSGAPYLDCHAWYFVPSSFRLLVEELNALGEIAFEVTQMFEPEGCEFYVMLRKSDTSDAKLDAAELEARRKTLLMQAFREVRTALLATGA